MQINQIQNMKKSLFFFLLFACTISFATDTPYSHPISTFVTNLTFENKNPHNPFPHGIRTSHDHTHHQPHSGYYAYLSAADFQRMFAGEVNENSILSNYELYAYPHFCAYARTFSSYNEFIIALDKKIKTDKQFSKKTAYIPGFSYSFGLTHEKSGFHDFINDEARHIVQTCHRQKGATKQRSLHISKQDLDHLEQEWSTRNEFAQGNIWLTNRLNALQITRNHKNKSSHPSFATELDYQLQQELTASRHTMNQLERRFAHKYHVQVLAPVVYHYATQAEYAHNAVVAFELSDFCYMVTQVLTHGMHVLYDASYAIGKGVAKGVNAIMSVDHWKDIITGCVHLGLLFADALGQENALDYSIALARSSQDSNAVLHVAQQHCAYTQEQKDAINHYVQETYKKIKSKSWQELLQDATEIGTTMILDTVALNAVGGFARATSGSLVKNLIRATESGSIFTEQYAVEVAGFGKLIVEEGTEVSVNISNVVKNNLDFFIRNNITPFTSKQSILSLLSDINNLFEQLLNSAKVCIKGNNTAAGRAFQKHVAREHSGFLGEITGNALKNTEQGMKYINKIIKSLDVKFIVRNKEPFGEILDVRLPDGMGARWSADGKTFIGFLEKYTNKL